MLSHVIPLSLVTDRIPIKLQLTGKSRLIFELIHEFDHSSPLIQAILKVFNYHI